MRDGVLNTWCNKLFKVDEDRYVRGFRDGAIVTCVRCLNNEFKKWIPQGALRDIIIANTVKALRETDDTRVMTEIDAAVSIYATSVR